MLKTFTAAAALAVALPMGAQAASVSFTDQAAFEAALAAAGLASQPSVTETFDVADQLIGGSGTTFGSGLTVTATDGSADNNVTGEVLRISLDSTNAAIPASPLTSTVQFDFPVATRFVSLFFGENGVGGIGNDSGTTLTLSNGFSESFSLADPGYLGFFGILSDDAFSSLTFTSNNTGTFTDDDIRIDDVTFSAVPVPAALPLMLVGLGALGIARARRKA